MSAPATHDPRFVNTRDGVCWEQRAVTEDGRGLYAVEGSCKCPPFKMATLAELAERGIVGSADVLPVPVSPARRTLDQVEDELTGANLSLYEEELLTERLRWALASAKRGRSRLRAQVAALLAERHETNQALDDAVQELRANAGLALPWAASMDDGDLSLFLNDMVSAAMGRWRSEPEVPDRTVLADIEKVCADWRTPGEGLRGDADDEAAAERPVNELTQVFAPVASLREVSSREEPHDSPLHQSHRVPHDLPVPDGCRLSAGDLDEISRDAWFGGGAS